jgi:hypothetical protein
MDDNKRGIIRYQAGVMRGDAAGKGEAHPPPLLFRVPPLFDVLEAVRATEHGAEGNDEKIREPGSAGAFHPRGGPCGKRGDE